MSNCFFKKKKIVKLFDRATLYCEHVGKMLDEQEEQVCTYKYFNECEQNAFAKYLQVPLTHSISDVSSFK